MIKVRNRCCRFAFFATLSCLTGSVSAQEPSVFQMNGPNGSAYPVGVTLPDTSCQPAFRGGDCNDCCFDLWRNYCVERKPGCGTTRPTFGQGIGLLSHLGGGDCLGGLAHCGGGSCGHGCSAQADCSGGCEGGGCDTCAAPPVSVPPTPQASQPAPRPPVASTPAPTSDLRAAPTQVAAPPAPVPPSPAETAPVRQTAPQPPTEEIETGIREEVNQAAPVAPLPPNDLEEMGIPRNVLPDALPNNDLPSLPPEPTTSVERSFIHPVSISKEVLPQDDAAGRGMQRLLQQLNSGS